MNLYRNLYRDNIFAKKIIKNISAVLASAILLSGCSGTENAVEIKPHVEPTNGITIVEPTTAPTPVPTLTPTPEPTPFVRSSYEIPSEEELEERLQMYHILDDNRTFLAYDIFALDLITKDGDNKSINVIIDNFYVGAGTYIVKDFATDTELFSFSENDPGFFQRGSPKRKEKGYYCEDIKITPLNPYFEGAKINYISSNWCDWFYDHTKPFISDDVLYDWAVFLTEGHPNEKYDTRNYSYKREDVVRAICTWLPEEYAITTFDLLPELFIEDDK